jgi:subtilisin-like proprotein convertase family protein
MPTLETDASHEPAEPWMTTRLRTAAWLMTAFLLTACGGGSEPTSVPVAITCDSTRLWAAHPATSGVAIPDNNNSGIEVRWENQNCALKSVSSATLEVCLNHARPSDLVWSLTQPTNSNPTPVPITNSWGGTDASCNFNAGQFQRINLGLGTSITTQGNWAVQVKDTQPGDTGSLIQWRLVFEGMK